MANSKVEINLSINDEVIGFVEKEPGMREIESYGEIRLPRGVIKNGYIKEPDILLDKLKSIFKSFRIKAKKVRWVLSEQNSILREMDIEKAELERISINDYINLQIGKTIHFPFKNPIFNHFIKEAKDDSITISLYILDSDMIHDYMDIFERLHLTEISYEMPELALFRLYYQPDEEINNEVSDVNNAFFAPKFTAQVTEYEEYEEGLLLLTLYDTMFYITIFDREFPVLSLLEDIENPETVYDTTDLYISRISNYYKFNRNSGKKGIQNVVVFNLNTTINDEVLSQEMSRRLTGLKFKVFEMEKKSQYYKRLLTGGCYIPLAASLYK